MADQGKSAAQIVKDWWGVVVIALAVLGGYWWLEQNFARLDMLAAEKCNLSYEIRLTKADIEFRDIDEEITLHRSELENLLQLANPPQRRTAFKKAFIDSLEGRMQDINNQVSCLRRAKDSCFQNDTGTDKCYE